MTRTSRSRASRSSTRCSRRRCERTGSAGCRTGRSSCRAFGWIAADEALHPGRTERHDPASVCARDDLAVLAATHLDDALPPVAVHDRILGGEISLERDVVEARLPL